MAGSIKYFKYTGQDDTVYALRQDEGNGEAIGNPDLAAADTDVINEIPKNLEPRYALYKEATLGYQRKIVVCDKDENVSTLPKSLTLKTDSGDLPFSLTYFRGEAYRRIPLANDSGLTDGDAT